MCRAKVRTTLLYRSCQTALATAGRHELTSTLRRPRHQSGTSEFAPCREISLPQAVTAHKGAGPAQMLFRAGRHKSSAGLFSIASLVSSHAVHNRAVVV